MRLLYFIITVRSMGSKLRFSHTPVGRRDSYIVVTTSIVNVLSVLSETMQYERIRRKPSIL